MRIGDSPLFQPIPDNPDWTQKERDALGNILDHFDLAWMHMDMSKSGESVEEHINYYKENLSKLDDLVQKLPPHLQPEVENLIRNANTSIDKALGQRKPRDGIDEIGQINVIARQMLDKWI